MSFPWEIVAGGALGLVAAVVYSWLRAPCFGHHDMEEKRRVPVRDIVYLGQPATGGARIFRVSMVCRRCGVERWCDDGQAILLSEVGKVDR